MKSHLKIQTSSLYHHVFPSVNICVIFVKELNLFFLSVEGSPDSCHFPEKSALARNLTFLPKSQV
jgi:hypothetical protein